MHTLANAYHDYVFLESDFRFPDLRMRAYIIAFVVVELYRSSRNGTKFRRDVVTREERGSFRVRSERTGPPVGGRPLPTVPVTVSDRQEHAFPVTDSSGQTLPHNMYHLLRACGM